MRVFFSQHTQNLCFARWARSAQDMTVSTQGTTPIAVEDNDC